MKLLREKQSDANPRTPEQLREHYEVEKALAHRLKNAPASERPRLYHAVYSELYQRVTHHPRSICACDPIMTAEEVRNKMVFLERFLTPETRFAEVGAGDGSLSMEVARRVKKVYALDVAHQLREVTPPPNFELVILHDGCTIPLPEGSIDVAYSNQVIEHIHPDDASEQLRNLYRTLSPGGIYICITPNRAAGPHDISKFFDEVATGFHLMEYTAGQLALLFRSVGFGHVKAYTAIRNRWFPRVPRAAITLCEMLCMALPYSLRVSMADAPVVRNLLALTIVGIK